MDKETQRIYELGLLLMPSLAEEQILGVYGEIKKILEKNGAVFISEESPKIKALTYTMTKSEAGKNIKCNTAYFGWVKFETDADKVSSIKSALDVNKNILRYLIVKTVKENTLYGAKIAMNERSSETIQAPKKEVKDENAPQMNVEEIDKTIEELVA